MANLYTKTGDEGMTGLVGGSRVRKDSPRVDCYGTIDEANACLGMAYALSKDAFVRTCLDKIQHTLFLFAAEIASDERGKQVLGTKVITDSNVTELEDIVDQCTLITGQQQGFVVPGVNSPSAMLHVARTVVRRAERKMIAAREMLQVREVLFRYLNRLSDAVYALARWEEVQYCKEHGNAAARDFIF